MSSPIRVTDSVFVADGGSAWFELADAKGRKIAVGVAGRALLPDPLKILDLNRYPPQA